MDEALTHALHFLRRGLSVIPVPRPRPNVPPGQPGDGKVPAIAWRDYQDRLPTEEEVRNWFSGVPMNVAIITGTVSGVVVIDADDPAALRWCTQRLPYTPWQTRTSRGFHLWYAHPGIRIPNRARLETGGGRLAIDVRGDGGYVIAPGSIHASGAIYECGGDWSEPLAALPRLWPGWLQRAARPVPSRPNLPRPSGDVVERARRYLAAVPRPEIGLGSDAGTLYAACRLVRGFQLGAAEAEALLWEWAGNRPGWTREWIARKVLHAERYGSEPIGALR
jgi:hypothetical protein